MTVMDRNEFLRPLAELAGKDVRFTACTAKEEMPERVTEFLG